MCLDAVFIRRGVFNKHLPDGSINPLYSRKGVNPRALWDILIFNVCPITRTGLFSMPWLCHETGMLKGALRGAFKKLIDAGFITIEKDGKKLKIELVDKHGMVRFTPPENDESVFDVPPIFAFGDQPS